MRADESPVGLPTIEISEAYANRSVRFLELLATGGWALKVYGIAYRRELPRGEAVEAAKVFIAQRLPQPAADGRHGIGFLIVHDGRDACWLLADWWLDEDTLYQQLYSAPLEPPIRFAPVEDGPVACVWELEVLKFERDAWVDSMLRHPESPDLAGYLRAQLNADV